jgi:hypothetical protein
VLAQRIISGSIHPRRMAHVRGEYTRDFLCDENFVQPPKVVKCD